MQTQCSLGVLHPSASRQDYRDKLSEEIKGLRARMEEQSQQQVCPLAVNARRAGEERSSAQEGFSLRKGCRDAKRLIAG